MDAYKAILNVVSLLFILYANLKALVWHMWRFKDFLINYLWLFVYALMPKKRRILLDKNHVPKHLGILLAEDDVIVGVDQSLNTLADIFADSCRYGISIVTVYDPYGHVTCGSTDVIDRLSILTETKLRGKSYFTISVNGQMSYKSDSKKRLSTDKLDIRLIDYRSGRRSVVNLARKLCLEKSLEKVDTKIVDQRLADDQQLTNVDFVLKFGSTDSVLGFPPLSLPITEFVFLPSIRNFDELSFVECLEKFVDRDRRHGK